MLTVSIFCIFLKDKWILCWDYSILFKINEEKKPLITLTVLTVLILKEILIVSIIFMNAWSYEFKILVKIITVNFFLTVDNDSIPDLKHTKIEMKFTNIQSNLFNPNFDNSEYSFNRTFLTKKKLFHVFYIEFDLFNPNKQYSLIRTKFSKFCYVFSETKITSDPDIISIVKKMLMKSWWWFWRDRWVKTSKKNHII